MGVDTEEVDMEEVVMEVTVEVADRTEVAEAVMVAAVMEVEDMAVVVGAEDMVEVVADMVVGVISISTYVKLSIFKPGIFRSNICQPEAHDLTKSMMCGF